MDPQSHTTAHRLPYYTMLHSPRHTNQGAYTRRQSLTLGVTCPRKSRRSGLINMAPNTTPQSEPRDFSQGHPMVPEPGKQAYSQAAPHHCRHTRVCTGSHTQRKTHTPSHPPSTPSPGPHTETQSQGFTSRPHTCTAAHTSLDRGLEGLRWEDQTQGSCPSSTPSSPTWSHQPTSHGLEQVSQKKSTKGILES